MALAVNIIINSTLMVCLIIIAGLEGAINLISSCFTYLSKILYLSWYKISKINFWFIFCAIISTGASLRYSIEFFFNLNVLSTPFSLISIVYYLIMAILLPLYTLIINKLLLNGTNNLISYIKVIIIAKTFWFGIVNVFLIGFAIRVNISYWDILPMLYSTFYSYIFLDFKSYFYHDYIFNMMPNNNIKAGKINGAVFVNDPLNQGYIYNPNGNNQPLLGNIGRGLESQRRLGLSSLSKYTFTPQQEQYVLTFLLYRHPDVYNNIMQGQVGNLNEPQWWKQSNTKTFNQLLINGN